MKFIFYITVYCFCFERTLGQADNTSETVGINPAFEEVAPCPCDLTLGACDRGCCCDSECSDDVKRTFTCIPSLPGGLDAPPPEYDCRSDHHNKVDWFPLLCVEFEYNAFLGYFYNWQYKISQGLQAFLDRMATVTSYLYREDEPRLVEDTLPNGYGYGVRVKTAKNISGNQLSGILTIPQPTLAGQCLDTAPVRYLKDLDLSCSYEMSDSICSNTSVLSALFYVQSSSQPYFSVLEEQSSVVPVIAETNVNYLCATDATAYIRNTGSSPVVAAPPDLFDYTFPANDSCVDTCGNDICVDLASLPKTEQAASAAVTPACSNQDPALLQTLVNVAGECRNAVLDVDYTIKWDGHRITKLDANIILGDVPLQNTAGINNVLTQKYKTVFVHNFTGESNSTSSDNFFNITDTTYARSGKSGYDIGKAIHSGSKVNDETVAPPQFLYVTTDATRQMAVFKPDADGYCYNAGRRSLVFGEDISTSCKLPMALANFSDCSSLRKLIINRLNNLMPSDVLGRRGYNDPNDAAYWIDVMRHDLTMLCVASEYWPLGLSPVDNRTGVCRNITSGIHLDILYAETGRSNDFPIYEILGSHVNYSVSTWEVSCSGPTGAVCKSGGTQPFYLSSSVRFIKVPAQTPEPIAKYYLTPEEDDVELCPGDRCWDNLFYPLTGRYRSNDSYEYVYGMFAFIIVFIIAYLFVTRPWW